MVCRAALILVVVCGFGCSTPDDPEGDGDSSSDVGDATSSPTATSASTSAPSTSATTSTTTANPTADPTEDSSGDPTTETTQSSDATEASDDGGVPVGCVDYDAFEPSVVAFRADVMPIFAAACAQCHGDESASIYFGAGGTTEAEAAAVYTKLLTGVPKQAPHLAFVEPGDPLHSYMLAKVEYAIPGGTCSEVECDEPGCELPAPPAGPLADGDKAILRSWILGGALDD